MKRPVLAFDTSGWLGTIAIGTADRLLAEITIGASARHAESLLPSIDSAMRQAGVARDDLRAIVVGAGPGSFTGVRIAGATAKGLVAGLDLPLYAFSSLAMIAASAGTAEPVCALFDARRGEVYAACHRFEHAPSLASMTTLMAPTAAPVDSIVELLGRQDPLYVGEGALRYAERIRASGGRVGAAIVATPRAAALLQLFAYAGEAARVHEPTGWTPAYIRAPNVTVPKQKIVAGASG